MHACGFSCPTNANEPLDHIATECELLQYLASLAGGTVTPPKGFNTSDLPGASPAAAYASFLESHAAAWMPRFAASVMAETQEPFYKVAAALLHVAIWQSSSH